MDESPTIAVTLSDALLKELRQRAQAEGLPLSWLVAGMVYDTITAWDLRATTMRASQGRAVRAFGSSSSPSPQAWN
jgi:hypothetical protein